MDAATANYVISQVGRVLDAEIIYRNRKYRMGLDAKLEKAKDETIAYWLKRQRQVHTTPPLDNPWQAERTNMSITGLKSGAFQAMLAEMRKEIAEAQNQGVADVVSAKDQAKAEIKNTISGVKDKIKTEVSDALQEFSEFTNGGPA